MSWGEKILMGAGAVWIGTKVFGWIGKAAYKNIDYTLGRPRINWATSANGRISIEIPVQIQNHNSIGVTITEVTGTIFYGTVPISAISLPYAIQVRPNDIANFIVSLSVNSGQLFNDITNAIVQNGAFATLANRIIFDGLIKTDLINIPLNTAIPIA